jgi:hypothetical protein
MKRGIVFSVALIMLSSANLLAQAYYSEGFIVTLSGDTVRGTIKFKPASKYGACILKTGKNTSKYTGDQIKGFGFNIGRYFSSEIIPHCFTEIIIDGPFSLYRSGYTFYVRKAGDQLYQLMNRQIADTTEVIIEGSREKVYGYMEDVKWKGILTVLTSDCADSYQMIQNVEYDEKSLAKLVTEYNHCKEYKFRDLRIHSDTK